MRRRLTAVRELDGIRPGLIPLSVRHHGNATQSLEEAAAVADIVRDLVGRAWTTILIGESGQFFEQNQDNRHLGVLDARQIIQPFFKNQKVLTSTIVPGLTQGCAHLWSNGE